ncbi:MAG: hypothetical protein MJZ41_16490 [Bacteroidaceae bacterium]|nr:hypothetical protein [Bacteroidaceae bacterium]
MMKQDQDFYQDEDEDCIEYDPQEEYERMFPGSNDPDWNDEDDGCGAFMG